MMAFSFRFVITPLVTGINMEDYAANVEYANAVYVNAMPVGLKNQVSLPGTQRMHVTIAH